MKSAFVVRALDAAAGRRIGRWPRLLAGRLLGGRLRVVRVLTGVARGARLELDLGSERAYWIGHYEPKTQAFLRAHVGPGDVVYDVGAHIGFFSVAAARLGAQVVAVEPAPRNAARIRRQAALNGAPIEVVEAAAWDSSEGVALAEHDTSREWRVVEGRGVASTTLDQVAKRLLPPTLIKIDVEGSEGRVLAGAAHVIERYRPAILCEIHTEGAGDQVRSLLDGYTIETLGGPGLIAARPQGLTIE